MLIYVEMLKPQDCDEKLTVGGYGISNEIQIITVTAMATAGTESQRRVAES